MDRDDHRPLSVEQAKSRLREAARSGDAGGALGTDVLSLVRQRPLVATGVALAAGVAFGASRRVRSQVMRSLLRMLDRSTVD